MTSDATPALELVRDFVNTLDVESGTESLDEGWLAAHGLEGATVAGAVVVREAIRELLLANNRLPADVAGAQAVLDRAARETGLRVGFEHGRARVRAEGGLGPILAALAEATASDDWGRLKACRAETCHWAFVDRARNRSRAWCSMSVCGNRRKARRFRERHGGRGGA